MLWSALSQCCNWLELKWQEHCIGNDTKKESQQVKFNQNSSLKTLVFVTRSAQVFASSTKMPLFVWERQDQILADEKHACSPMERLSGLAWTKYSFSPVARNFLNVVLRISVSGSTSTHFKGRNEPVGREWPDHNAKEHHNGGKGHEPVRSNLRMEIWPRKEWLERKWHCRGDEKRKWLRQNR